MYAQGRQRQIQQLTMLGPRSIVIARLDRATQYSKARVMCDAPNEHSGILGPRIRGDDDGVRGASYVKIAW